MFCPFARAQAGRTITSSTLWPWTARWGCTGNGPNCREAVLDETATAVVTIDDNGFEHVAVVRRPMLQMPDIAFYEQEGHFGMSTPVYRFDGSRWRPYLCNYVSPINHDPDPNIVADQPGTP